MAALSPRKIAILRSLVEAAPDRVVGSLQMALAGAGDDAALSGVRRLVDDEVGERRLRNTVLQPIAPMCVGDGDDPRRLTFPARVLPMIWRALRESAPSEVRLAEEAYHEFSPEDSSAEAFDHLARITAYAVRRRDSGVFRQIAELCDAARPGGAEQLAACLDLAGVVRRAIVRIPEWLASFNEQSAAAARLAYKDAVAVADDAGPCFFEMLAAQLAYPWMVLRIISEVMDKPTERYLADSEMAVFSERVMDEIDDALRAIARFDLNEGAEAGHRAGKLVDLITLQTTELETCIDLNKDHGWGARIAKQKATLASVVEGRLQECEKLTLQSLPMQPAKLRRVRRPVPRLNLPPDPALCGRALALLHFAQEVRSSANYGGFAATRAKVLEKLADYLDHYVEEVLDLVRTGDAEDEEIAQAFLALAADYSLLVQGEKAADLIRRRAVAVAQPQMPFAAEA